MPATIPASYVDLLTGPVYAVFTTIASNGQPENTVVWCSWDGSYVLVNTAGGRRKHKNVLENPRVALTVIDPKDPYRWLDVRGTVEAIEEDTGYANINAHAKLYAGVDQYYGGVAPAERKGKEERLILKIRPDRVLVYPE